MSPVVYITILLLMGCSLSSQQSLDIYYGPNLFQNSDFEIPKITADNDFQIVKDDLNGWTILTMLLWVGSKANPRWGPNQVLELRAIPSVTFSLYPFSKTVVLNPGRYNLTLSYANKVSLTPTMVGTLILYHNDNELQSYLPNGDLIASAQQTIQINQKSSNTFALKMTDPAGDQSTSMLIDNFQLRRIINSLSVYISPESILQTGWDDISFTETQSYRIFSSYFENWRTSPNQLIVISKGSYQNSQWSDLTTSVCRLLNNSVQALSQSFLIDRAGLYKLSLTFSSKVPFDDASFLAVLWNKQLIDRVYMKDDNIKDKAYIISAVKGNNTLLFQSSFYNPRSGVVIGSIALSITQELSATLRDWKYMGFYFRNNRLQQQSTIILKVPPLFNTSTLASLLSVWGYTTVYRFQQYGETQLQFELTNMPLGNFIIKLWYSFEMEISASDKDYIEVAVNDQPLGSFQRPKDSKASVQTIEFQLITNTESQYILLKLNPKGFLHWGGLILKNIEIRAIKSTQSLDRFSPNNIDTNNLWTLNNATQSIIPLLSSTSIGISLDINKSASASFTLKVHNGCKYLLRFSYRAPEARQKNSFMMLLFNQTVAGVYETYSTDTVSEALVYDSPSSTNPNTTLKISFVSDLRLTDRVAKSGMLISNITITEYKPK